MTVHDINTKFGELPLDEIIPPYRNQEYDLPPWAYAAAEQIANSTVTGNTLVMTRGGISSDSKETRAAVIVATMAAHQHKHSQDHPA